MNRYYTVSYHIIIIMLLAFIAWSSISTAHVLSNYAYDAHLAAIFIAYILSFFRYYWATFILSLYLSVICLIFLMFFNLSLNEIHYFILLDNAPPIPIFVMLIASALIASKAWIDNQTHQLKPILSLPLILLVDGIIVALFLWQFLIYQESKFINASAKMQLNHTKNIISFLQQDRIKLLRQYLSAQKDYEMQVELGGNTFGNITADHSSWEYRREFTLNNEPIKIIVQPKAQLIEQYLTVYPYAVLLVAIILSLLLSFITLLFNISDRNRKKLAQEIKTRRAIEDMLLKSNNYLKEFSYMLSHDLKTPLQNIIQLVEMLQDENLENFTEDGKRHLILLKSRSFNMQDMIEGILQFSRIGHTKHKLEKVDLNKLIEEIIFDLNINSNIVSIKNQLPTLYTYKVPLKQVFMNLISNAKQHGAQDSLKIIIDSKIKDNSYQFCVANNGTKIPINTIGKIFNMFYSSNTNQTGNNTGIGLAIVKKIVEHHGGKIWLDDGFDELNVFCFLWPNKVDR